MPSNLQKDISVAIADVGKADAWVRARKWAQVALLCLLSFIAGALVHLL